LRYVLDTEFNKTFDVLVLLHIKLSFEWQVITGQDPQPT
jgi:hypothetical protein